MIYKTKHRKLKNEQYEPHWKLGVNSDAKCILTKVQSTVCTMKAYDTQYMGYCHLIVI
jgi:hypothetical protein